MIICSEHETSRGIRIIVIFDGKEDDSAYEIYYRRAGYPMRYAFGIPSFEPMSRVIEIAEANADDYEDLWDEEP